MFGSDAEMMRMMFGCHAVKIPCWTKTYGSGSGVAFVGASKDTKAMFGADKNSHVLMIGEMIIRPHLVLESKHCTGYGAAGLLTENDIEAWSEGNILVDPMGMELRMDGKLVKRKS